MKERWFSLTHIHSTRWTERHRNSLTSPSSQHFCQGDSPVNNENSTHPSTSFLLLHYRTNFPRSLASSVTNGNVRHHGRYLHVSCLGGSRDSFNKSRRPMGGLDTNGRFVWRMRFKTKRSVDSHSRPDRMEESLSFSETRVRFGGFDPVD